MAIMKPFTFALLLLAQRVDEALRLERLRPQPSLVALTGLQRRRRVLRSRLQRSLALSPLAAS
jgi:hypothetical protein